MFFERLRVTQPRDSRSGGCPGPVRGVPGCCVRAAGITCGRAVPSCPPVSGLALRNFLHGFSRRPQGGRSRRRLGRLSPVPAGLADAGRPAAPSAKTGAAEPQGSHGAAVDLTRAPLARTVLDSRVYFSRMTQGIKAPTLDPQLTDVRRAFDAAFRRMCEATNSGEQRDELSNLLHHLYRLGELRSRRWGTNDRKLSDNDFNAHTSHIPGVLGALWIRGYDTHEIATLAKSKDAYSDFYTKISGILVWQCVIDMPFIKKPRPADRYVDYQLNLENKSVLDSLRFAFDALAALT